MLKVMSLNVKVTDNIFEKTHLSGAGIPFAVKDHLFVNKKQRVYYLSLSSADDFFGHFIHSTMVSTVNYYTTCKLVKTLCYPERNPNHMYVFVFFFIGSQL